ncbi:hypothetical protein IQ251_13375 [Saccharopolyspora sp. HNM0983]|uniref:Zinc finger protein n=2 Tax=Saccharopolyspora montiporae TaxID=2781240 RepID=A0A929BD62_9PSEU|nr:hypothetical protein [Saccharopolyspora sp. HNM0983]
MRHATLDAAETSSPNAVRVDTLCGHRLAAQDDGLAWFWQTCAPCLRAAHRFLAAPRSQQSG